MSTTPETHLRAALDALGYVDDPELGDTPRLFAGLLTEFAPGQPRPALTTFPAPGPDPVILRDLPFYSLCAHHLLPFFGHATIGYVPGAWVAGLGGVARVLQHHARQPQLQERLTRQLAQDLFGTLEPTAITVRLTARQMCMEMRGARSTGQIESTVTLGAPHPALTDALRGR
jgi:GTP cyclohydrolase I